MIEWWINRGRRCDRHRTRQVRDRQTVGWVDGETQGAGSRDKVKQIERNVDDVGGRARVTRDEERVLRESW